jgi:hypothetical protein
MVQTFGSHRSHPSLSDGIRSGRPKRRTNLPYSETPHGTIEVRAVAAVAIVNQDSRRRLIPVAAFHDSLRGPVRYYRLFDCPNGEAAHDVTLY